MRLSRVIVALGIAGAMFSSSLAQEQTKPTGPLTLKATVEYALSHYPAVRQALERKNAAAAGVGLSRTAYLPSANVLWQGNRATRNNIFGLLLPQSVIPSISGPVLPNADNNSVWGSAAGVLVGWEPFDFGYRQAGVDTARANEQTASAELDLSKLGVASAAAERFIALAAAQQDVRTAAANVQRRESFARVVHTLVNNEFKPGADASRADAELAAAKIVLIRAQTSEKVNTAGLADLLGISPAEVKIDATELLLHPPPSQLSQPEINKHPAATAESARVDAAKANLHVAERSYYPRFLLQSAVNGRGSGANVDGSVAVGTGGLNLQRENWAVGFTASMNVLDIFAQRERKKIAGANERAEEARNKQTLQDLNAQATEAQASYEGALAIAQATPEELFAAQQAETQARARYEAGLTSVLEVADAQSLLVRAESENDVAKLNTWRAIFGLASAEGDLTPVLSALSSSPTGGR
jgi:outer membrane protein